MTENKDQPPAASEKESSLESSLEPRPETTPEMRPETTAAEAEPQRDRGARRESKPWVKRILVIVLLILLVLLLLGWRYCKRGGGAGGSKAGDGSQNQSTPAQMTASSAPKSLQSTCRLRVDKKGISIKGKLLSVPEAVKACGAAKRAELSVTGDATFGTVKQLRQALRTAGIAVVRR